MAEYMEYEWRRPVVTVDVATRAQSSSQEFPCALAETRRLAAEMSEDDLQLRAAVACETDHSLRRFLYARAHDAQRAAALLLAYHRHRRDNERVSGRLSAEAADVRAALEDGLPGVLEARDRRGRCVLVLPAASWDAARYSLLAVYRALLVSLERLTLGDLQNLANGFVVIVDWTEFPMSRAARLSPRSLRLMIDGLQDCFPARFKAVHFVNQPWYVEAALLLVRQYLDERMRERVYTHGNNLSTLHEHVPRDVLPAELGGECPSYDSRRWFDMMTSQAASTNNELPNVPP